MPRRHSRDAPILHPGGPGEVAAATSAGEAGTNPASADHSLLPAGQLRYNAAARREQLRRHAANLGVHGVLVYGWRRGLISALSGYLPGYVTNTASLWIPAGTDTDAATAAAVDAAAELDAPGEGPLQLGVRFPFEQRIAHERSGLPTRTAADPLDLVPHHARRVGLLSGDTGLDETPARLQAAAESRGVHLIDLADWFDEAREVKTVLEVQGLSRAAAVGDRALRAVSGVRTQDNDFTIAALVEAAARKMGAFRANCLVGIGRGAVVTEPFGAQLGPREPVGLELNMVHGGFFSHVQATVLPPGAEALDHRAVQVARRARSAVVASMRPGVAVTDAVAAGQRVLDAEGLGAALEYDFGHGLGFDTPEHPRLLPDSSRHLREGAVIAVHCGLRRDGGETAYTGGPVWLGPAGATDLVDDPVVLIQRS